MSAPVDNLISNTHRHPSVFSVSSVCVWGGEGAPLARPTRSTHPLCSAHVAQLVLKLHKAVPQQGAAQGCVCVEGGR